MSTPRIAFVVVLLLLALGCDSAANRQPASPTAAAAPYIPSKVLRTAHFAIHSSATEAETAAVGEAVEALYRAYTVKLGLQSAEHELQLVLYKDQAEFKAHNRSAPWAEAYYKRPYAFAYVGAGDHPYHWMLHEVTHQLATEASGYKLRRWLSEGMASYLGTSKLSAGELQLGEPDRFTYPIWWLQEVRFDESGLPMFSGTPMPSLKQLIEEMGPPVAGSVNSYYVAWWSLVHFLLEDSGGAMRNDVMELLREGGTSEAFQTRIGAYAKIEPRWHAHLRRLSETSVEDSGGH